LLVLLTIAAAFPITIIFIIPKFADLFNAFDTPLPVPTRILIGLNFILTHYWMPVILVLVSAVILFRKIATKKKVRPYWDRFKLKIPVFGALFLKIAMTRFTKMSSIMIASGIPILNVLEIVKGAVGNKIISDSVDNIIAGITEGESMALSMKASGLYPGIVTQMVKVGEDTGKLDQLLMNVGEYYDTQIDYTVKNLAVLVEPMLIVALGAMVLFLALGIFLPMWNLASLYMKIGGLG
jgi:MSHA biogenesis protein MshG